MLRSTLMVCCLMILAACATYRPSPTEACERTINLYARHLDLGSPAQVADLFSEDATWQLGKTRLQGREVIREYFSALGRNAERVSRHSQTNIVIDWDSETRARGIVYLTLYRGEKYRGEKQEESFAPLAGQPLFVGHYEDEYRYHDGRCQIGSRLVVPAFVAE